MPKFHVVCHDYPFEHICETEEAADLGAYLHHKDLGHDVEFEEVAES